MLKPDLLSAERCAETLHDHGLITASHVIRELIDAVMHRDIAIAALKRADATENQPYASLSKWPVVVTVVVFFAVVAVVAYAVKFRWPV